MKKFEEEGRKKIMKNTIRKEGEKRINKIIKNAVSLAALHTHTHTHTHTCSSK